jgi:hypothetical protein
MTKNAELTPRLSSEIKSIATLLSDEFPESTPHRIVLAMTVAQNSGAIDENDFLNIARRSLLGPAQ